MNIEDKDILDAVVKRTYEYLNKVTTGYTFIKHKYEVHTTVRYYKTHAHYFDNEKKLLQLTIDIVEYEDEKMGLFFHVRQLMEEGGYFEVSEYFRLIRKLDYRKKFDLNDYPGETLSDKLSHFFTWLQSVTDEQLINIFKGEDWVDVPFDWGDYK